MIMVIPSVSVGTAKAFNAVYSTAYEIDQKYGTSYFENFKKFAVYCQEKDFTVDGAIMEAAVIKSSCTGFCARS